MCLANVFSASKFRGVLLNGNISLDDHAKVFFKHFTSTFQNPGIRDLQNSRKHCGTPDICQKERFFSFIDTKQTRISGVRDTREETKKYKSSKKKRVFYCHRYTEETQTEI